MDKENSVVTCGCYLLLFIFNVLIGGWSVSYLLVQFLGKTIPFWGACLIGLFSAELTVPIAVVVWLLKSFGVL